MPQASVILQELLASLTSARHGATLVLDAATLGQTSAAGILDLFTNDLQITSFSLDDAVLPASVTGTVLQVSGHDKSVTLELTFEESLGEVTIGALFSAPAITALQQEFPALPGDFFSAIQVADATASVSVPGLPGPVTFPSPRYGVAGLVLPSAGLVTTSVAARVDGAVSAPAGVGALLVESYSVVTGYHVAPLATGWTFDQLGELMPGLGILAAFPTIIATGDLGLNTFDLRLYPDIEGLSSISLDVADIADPAKPLWTAAGGRVALTDVVVTLDLTYTGGTTLSLPGTGWVRGNFILGAIPLSVQIPSPPTGVWSLTASPDVPLPTLDDIATLLDGGSAELGSLLPAQLADVGGFELSYLRLAVDAGMFSLVEFTFAVSSTAPWKLIPGVLELSSLRIRMTVNGQPSVYGTVTGVIGLPDGAGIVVSFGRGSPLQPWQLDAVSPAIPLPSLGQLAQLAQGVDLAALVKAGGLDQLHFLMTDMNFGLTISPAKLTHLGLTLQLASADDPTVPELDWPIIPGVLTLTRFSFGFQLSWGATVTKQAFGTFVLNGLEFDVRFATQATGGASADGLMAEYSAQGTAGTVSVRDLIASVAPGIADEVPPGLEITLANAILAYLGTDGTKKFLFTMDITAGSAATGLPLPADMTTGMASLKVLAVSEKLSEQDVAYVNAMAAKPVLPATPGGIPAGFAFSGELTNFSIGQLLHDLDGTYGIGQVPEPLRTLELAKLSISYQTGTGTFAFALQAGFMVASTPVQVAVTITVLPSAQAPAPGADPYTAVTKGTKGYSATFTGQVTFADLQFNLVFDASDTGTDVLVADVVRTGDPVALQALIAGVSAEVAQAIPPGITIGLEEVKFVFLKQASSQWAFGLLLGAGINLSELPVVGSKLPPDATLAIENLQILYSSGELTTAQTAIINPLLPKGVVKLPDAVGEGIGFDADVTLGAETRHLHAGVTPPPPAALPPAALPPAGGSTTSGAPPTSGAPAIPASSTDPVKWLDVNKQFGIFSFQRVGVGYQDNVLLFALDASVALGPVAFSMQALTVGSPLTEFQPTFSLKGLALSFDAPPIAIGGAFLKERETVGGKQIDAYYGELIVQATTFSLKALGGWAPDADPAFFFIYLSVDVPLGGPPFLFVTGLAGGFGINSQLILPTIDQVATYPLLPGNAPAEQGTPAETIKAVIPALQRTFQPLAGQYWVAAGISFTSFEMIEAHAVVSVAFGVNLQIGVVGTCAMTFPTGAPDPVAYVEIDVVASFTPSTGLLAVDGKLSPASYLFGGFVKLTGGFAFYAWFSGESQGDFVVSLGGYHPAFTRPANYPVVPRLQLAFSLGPVKVVGQAYFALTPSMFMAGMRLTATFEAGPVKAWFDAGVDFLIAWAPFHYEAEAWVTIGCSVDLGLYTLSVQVGASLRIWGPEFGGEALVDLDVVSFTIGFGAAPALPDPVGWTTFATNFLPPPQPSQAASQAPVPHAAAPRAAAMAARAVTAAQQEPVAHPEPVPNILKATVAAGQLPQTAPGIDWVLDPDSFRILTASTIPANHGMWSTSAADTAELPNLVADYQLVPATPRTPAGPEANAGPEAAAAGPPPGMLLALEQGTTTYSGTQVWAPTLGIAPMNETDVASYLTLTLRRADEGGQLTEYVTGVTVTPQLGASSTALWGAAQSADLNAERLVQATLTGFAISAVPRHPAQVSDVPLLALIYGEGNTTGFGYQSPVVDQRYTVTSTISADSQAFTIDVAGDRTATLDNHAYVLSALADPWVAGNRSATLDELRRLGFTTTPGAAARLDTMAATALTDWPSAARIGSETFA